MSALREPYVSLPPNNLQVASVVIIPTTHNWTKQSELLHFCKSDSEKRDIRMNISKTPSCCIGKQEQATCPCIAHRLLRFTAPSSKRSSQSTQVYVCTHNYAHSATARGSTTPVTIHKAFSSLKNNLNCSRALKVEAPYWEAHDPAAARGKIEYLGGMHETDGKVLYKCYTLTRRPNSKQHAMKHQACNGIAWSSVHKSLPSASLEIVCK